MTDVIQCNAVQCCAGTSLARSATVISFFMVGSERVTWEITSVDKTGRCRLSISHAGGTIVEYFTSTAAALRREAELEALLMGLPAPDEVSA